MATNYRLFGAEMSPYSVKVRSYLRYKGIPHDWIPRNAASQVEYEKYAKLPIVPLVVTPDGLGIQDSTPIMEQLEALQPEPSIHPSDPVTRFMSHLLEEFGDEWGNKWMFHYRWARNVDQRCAAGRIARMRDPDASEEAHEKLAASVRERMVGRGWLVGSNEITGPQIETSFTDTLRLLDAHLAGRLYLFGLRPAFADFGLWAQIYEAWKDPTAGALIEGRASNLLGWVQRMLFPNAQGDFEPWVQIEPTLMPFLQSQVGGLFLPWTLANEKAITEQKDEFSVTLAGSSWTQKPQKYQTKSLAALRDKYRAVADRQPLDMVLDRVGHAAALRT
jgi:glutathione S-transferase